MTISDINTATVEGRLLMAALAILTTTPELIVQGEKVKGTDTTPDKMLGHVEQLTKVMYPD